MTPAEWKRVVGQIIAIWPVAAKWEDVTIAAWYRALMFRVPEFVASEVVRLWAESGQSWPPTGPELYGGVREYLLRHPEVRAERPELPESTEPPTYDDDDVAEFRRLLRTDGGTAALAFLKGGNDDD